MDQTSATVDSGLFALVTILRVQGMPAEPEQIRHQFAVPGQPFGSTELLRAAKKLGLKARLVNSPFDTLINASLPAIGIDNEGEYFILAKVAHHDSGSQEQAQSEQTAESETQPESPSESKALIMRAGGTQPQTLSESELAEIWSGDTIFLTKRGGLLDSFKEFDLSWFIPSMVKYRKLSFPFTKYGVIDAVVDNVSSDATVDEQRGLIYKARMLMKTNTLWVDGREVNLVPGMSISAEVKTGKRYLIEYVLTPLLRYKNESVRER